MCLYEIDKKIEPCRIGWKVFNKNKKELSGEYYGGNQLPINRWLKASDYSSAKIIRDYDISYRAGWHVFHTREDARDWKMDGLNLVIRKVKVRTPIVTGRQGGKVTVCKEILIIPNKKKGI